MKTKNLLPAVGQVAGRDDEHPFYSLQRQMNSLFDDFFSGFDTAARGLSGAGFVPPIDIKEDGKEFTIRAELPGVDEKDIEVTVSSDAVTIKGEKKEEKENKEKNYYYMERSYGSFKRVIPLTAEKEADKAKASFKNGVLSIKIPKSSQSGAKGTKISIKTT